MLSYGYISHIMGFLCSDFSGFVLMIPIILWFWSVQGLFNLHWVMMWMRITLIS